MTVEQTSGILLTQASRRRFLAKTFKLFLGGTALLAGCGGNDEDEIGMPTSELTPSVEKNREGILEADGWQIYIKRWQTIPDFLETKPEVETEVIEAVARNISGQTLDTRTFANLGLKITGQGRSYNTRNFVPTAYGEEFDEFEE